MRCLKSGKIWTIKVSESQGLGFKISGIHVVYKKFGCLPQRKLFWGIRVTQHLLRRSTYRWWNRPSLDSKANSKCRHMPKRRTSRVSGQARVSWCRARARSSVRSEVDSCWSCRRGRRGLWRGWGRHWLDHRGSRDLRLSQFVPFRVGLQACDLNMNIQSLLKLSRNFRTHFIETVKLPHSSCSTP